MWKRLGLFWHATRHPSHATRSVAGFALAGLLLGLGVLFALGADTTTTLFDPILQSKNALRLKDNTDSTYSYAHWLTGDGTHFMPSMDAVGRKGFFSLTDGTHTAPSMDAVGRAGYQTVTDGTNTMPTMDVVGRAGYQYVTDGTHTLPTMDAAARPGYVSLTDGTNTMPAGDVPARSVGVISGFPGTFVVGTSTGAAQANSPTLPAVSAKTNYCSGFTITGGGATGASAITCTLADGTKTLNFMLEVPAGVGTAISPLVVRFDPPLPASATNTAWTLTVPSFGSGNTAASSNIWGYVK